MIQIIFFNNIVTKKYEKNFKTKRLENCLTFEPKKQ